jgi:hypothetical protein
MGNIKRISSLVLLVWMMSCSKEKSVENGPGSGITLGTNCRVNTIIAADSLTGAGSYSLFTNFNATGQATKIEAFDSIAGNLDASATLTYSGDTIRISAAEYFVTDANKRVSKYLSLVDPADPASDQFIYNYTYDGGGYLIGKTLSVKSIPLPLVNFTYTWTGGNLVKIDGQSTIPGFTQKVLSSDLEYDASKSAKNFIQVFPDGFESFFYVMALDFGKKSKNVISKINMVTYDDQGAPANTYNTTITNLKFSNDGYLLEWYAAGDSFDALGIFSGRTLFKYKCY